MELIGNQYKGNKIYYDIEKIKYQISLLIERGYVGFYGRHLPYPKIKGNEMFSKLQEYGVNCKLVDYDKTTVRIVFTDLLDLPDHL